MGYNKSLKHVRRVAPHWAIQTGAALPVLRQFILPLSLAPLYKD